MNARRLGAAALALLAIMGMALAALGAPTAQEATPGPEVTPVYGDLDAAPLILLTEFDPWLNVIGSDSPTFVLYASGDVIYRVEKGPGEWEFRHALLSADALDALLRQFGVGLGFYSLEPHYDLVPKTDQVTSVIQVAMPNLGVHEVSVYGDLRRDEEAWAAAPSPYRRLFDHLTGYRNADSEPWLPEKIEALLWPYDTSDAAPWPKDWPGLDSPHAVPRDRGQYSVYLDAAELDALRALAREASAVEIDGETYALSLRLPFPHELAWPGGVDPRVTSHESRVTS